MSVCLPDYRIASGHNIALASLQNVSTLIRTLTGRQQMIAPNSQPVNPFPVETPVGDGYVIGGGKPNHEWVIGSVSILFLNHLLGNYLTTDAALVNSKEVTIYTPVFDIQTGLYKRYNAILLKPRPIEDFTYTRKRTVDLRLRFTHLVAL